MRRKRNLLPRLEALQELLLVSGRPMLNLKEAAQNYRAVIDYEACFQRTAPVEVEIGCGNGGFILEKAKREPSVDFFAVEISSNVILAAMEKVKREQLKNVRFLNIPAEILPCYLPEESVETIYLNFSTPLPEKSREKQRLTSSRFLGIYQQLLKSGGKIVQKTDSEGFFDYSLARFEENGFKIESVTRDLVNSEFAKDNIVTEYEQSFLSKGQKIFRAVARKKEQGEN